MKLRVIPLLLLTLLCAKVSAQETLLVITQVDGTRNTFKLSEKPEMTLSGEYCMFEGKTEGVWIPRKDLVDFHFETTTDAIETIKVSDIHTEFVGNNTIRISGVEPKAIKVFDMNGRMVSAEISGTKEETTVSLQQLPQGIYIVNYSGNSVKISKR